MTEPAPSPPVKKLNPALKFVLEMGPLLLFFVANSLFARSGLSADESMINSTLVLMCAVTIAFATMYAMTRRVSVMPLVTLVMVLVFGGLTLYLHDPIFIKIKVTIIYVLFGSALLGALAFGKLLLPIAFDAMLHLDRPGWIKLTIRWGIFFFALAVLNEIVWRNFPDYWVGFKTFGTIPLTLIFTLAQMPLILKHEIKPEQDGQAL